MLHSKQPRLSRCQFLRQSVSGLGWLALGNLVAEQSASAGPLAVKATHFPARAKNVIVLFLHGGLSHIDSFDPKPRLKQDNGKPVPFQRLLTFGEDTVLGLLQSPWEFRNRGQSGLPVSDLFPNIATCADDLCVVRSMVGDAVDHAAAVHQFHCGHIVLRRPSLGSWLLYGLGSENQNLPGFVMLKPGHRHGGANNYGSAFLPAEFQGTAIGSSDASIEDVSREPIPFLKQRELTNDWQRRELDLVQRMNRRHADGLNDPQLEARIEAFELAFRMQAEAPEVFEVEREPEATRKLYGLEQDQTSDFAWQCLVARRMVERGVRMVQCWTPYKWDQHDSIFRGHAANAAQVDQPVAALIKDLKARGLLQTTLVILCSEFGRTPWAQGRVVGSEVGRDHNPYGYTIVMAGGGVKSGFAYGQTDEFGYQAVEDRMHLHDLHATILHLMGLDHERLTYRWAGRDFRLTDVAGVVARKIVADV